MQVDFLVFRFSNPHPMPTLHKLWDSAKGITLFDCQISICRLFCTTVEHGILTLTGFPQVRKSSGKIYFLRVRKKSGNFVILSKVRKKSEIIKSKSQLKSKNDVCSQEMYSYGSLLVLITPFIEYVLKVTIKIILYHSKTVCKIYKLSILMAVRGDRGHTKSYVLLFISQEKSEFNQ